MQPGGARVLGLDGASVGGLQPVIHHRLPLLLKLHVLQVFSDMG